MDANEDQDCVREYVRYPLLFHKSSRRRPINLTPQYSRGIPLFGFPAFDAARNELTAMGWEPVSPADMDREVGKGER